MKCEKIDVLKYSNIIVAPSSGNGHEQGYNRVIGGMLTIFRRALLNFPFPRCHDARLLGLKGKKFDCVIRKE